MHKNVQRTWHKNHFVQNLLRRHIIVQNNYFTILYRSHWCLYAASSVLHHRMYVHMEKHKISIE